MRPELKPRVTEYTVCAHPDEDSINYHVYAITVQYRGRGLWAVCRHRDNLDADGRWDYESIPSEREDEWLAAHRFDVDTALRLAMQAAPKLNVNGMTAAGCWEWEQNRREARANV